MSGIDQGRAAKEPPLLRPREGIVLTARGSVMAFKAVAEQTDGDFSFMKRTLPPSGRRPPAHRHTNCSVAFFIFEGTVTVELEGAAMAGETTGGFHGEPRPGLNREGSRGTCGHDVPFDCLIALAPSLGGRIPSSG